MAVDKIQLLQNDLDSVNNGLQGLHERFNNFLLTDAFGQIDVEIDGATTFTTISIASPGLLGPIPNDSIFTVTHPDGSFAVTIRNEKATIPKGATSIVIYVDGNQPGDQVVDTYFGFPPGSLVSAPGYNQSDSTYAAGNNTDVQFNTNGRLDGDPSFTYDISTTKLTTPNIEVSGVIDGDIYASDGTSKVLENGTDGTDATFTGDVTGDLTGTADIADKVKVTSSTASTNKYIPFVTNFNDADANLLTNTSLKYQPNIGKLSATRVDATKFVGDVYASNSSSKVLENGTDGTDATFTGDVTGDVSGSSGSCTGNSATATKIASITNANIVQLTDTQTLTNKTLTDCEANTQAVGDNSTKIATTAFVLANAGTGGGTPGGTGNSGFKSVQYNDNNSFGGDTSFQYSPTSQILSVNTLIATSLGGTLANGITAAGSPPAGDDSLKVATTEWVLDNAGTGGTPASPTSSVQFNNSGSFGGSSDFIFAPTGYMGGPVLVLKARLHVEGESKFGDALNVSSGANSMATGTTTTASSKDAFSCGESTVASDRQSFAGGFETTASGPASVSWGAITTASGERAFVIGERNTASGINSFVGGGHSLANSPNSFAFGEYAEATAQAAFALGLHTDASGLCSITGGQYSQATMPFAVSIGNHSSSTGECATSFGLHTTASALGSFAGGNNATASGNYSFCFGDVSTATSNNALSIGYLTHATGSYSAAFGFNNQSMGQGAVTIGQQNIARGQHGFVGGFINDSKSNNSIVYGNFNNDLPSNTGSCQFLFGKYLNTPRDGAGNAPDSQFIVGRHNVYLNTQHHLFAVGNGPGIGAEANALTVDVSGRVGIGSPATSHQLQLSTDSAAKPSTSTWQITSDERIKTNIEDYTKGLDEIIQIDPKTFDYNGKAGFDESIKGNIGIIAQEIKDVFPETVSTYKAKLNEEDEEETELYNFNSHALTFALINSVKELNAEVQTLRKELNELKNK